MTLLRSVLLASVQAVAKVFIVASGGFVLARRGILGKEASSNLGKVTVSFTLPCLLFSRLSVSISPESLSESWTLPLASLCYTVSGLLLGSLAALLLRVPSAMKGDFVAAITFHNAQSLPVILLTAVIVEYDAFGPAREAEEMGVGYVAMFLLGYHVLMWSVGFHLVSTDAGEDGEGASKVKGNDPKGGDEESARLIDPSRKDSSHELIAFRKQSSVGDQPLPVLEKSFEERLEEAIQHEKSFLSTASSSPLPLRDDGGPQDDNDAKDDTVARDDRNGDHGVKSCMSNLKVTLKRLLNPPIIAVVTGFIVGYVPFLRTLFIEEAAPLRVFLNSADVLGGAAIPTSMLVLGANLSRRPEAGDDIIPFRFGIGIVICKLFIQPILGLAIVFGIDQSIGLPDNNLLWFVMLLQGCPPTANNMVMMSQLFGEGGKSMSRWIFYQYTVAPMSLCLFVSLYLAILFGGEDSSIAGEP